MHAMYYDDALTQVTVSLDTPLTCAECGETHLKLRDMPAEFHRRIVTAALVGQLFCENCTRLHVPDISIEEEEEEEPQAPRKLNVIVEWLMDHTGCDEDRAARMKQELGQSFDAFHCGNYGVAIVYAKDAKSLRTMYPSQVSPVWKERAFILVNTHHVSALQAYYKACFGKNKSVKEEQWLRAICNSVAMGKITPSVVEQQPQTNEHGKREREEEEEEEEEEESCKEKSEKPKRNRISCIKGAKQLLRNHGLKNRELLATAIRQLRTGGGGQVAWPINASQTVLRVPIALLHLCKVSSDFVSDPFDCSGREVEKEKYDVLVVMNDADQRLFKELQGHPERLEALLSEGKLL